MPTPISTTDAVDRVKLLTSFDAFPEVEGTVVEAFVVDAARPDADGLLPSDEDWTPTYDLNAACATVYELKAALVANRYDTSTDAQSLSRSQLIAQFRQMAKLYRDRIASTMRKAPPS
jgi:hypothetical protein